MGTQYTKPKDDGHKTVEILKSVPHPDHSPSEHLNDIGLVQIQPISPFTETIRPACLYTGNVKDDQVLEDVIWLRPGEDFGIKKFQTDVVPHSRCGELYKKLNIVLNSNVHLCTNAKDINVLQGMVILKLHYYTLGN